MEYWLQRFLLIAKLVFFAVTLSNTAYADNDDSASPSTLKDLDTQYFELGAYVGLLNIEDFTSEFSFGLSANFNADEHYFLQANIQFADTELSSFEQSQGQNFTDDDRDFIHYNFLLGFNVFQGEHFFSKGKAKLSTLYVVGGVGDTEFGGESAFTYVLGVGYQLAITREILFRADYRDFIFKTNLIGNDEFTHNSQLSAGLSYLF